MGASRMGDGVRARGIGERQALLTRLLRPRSLVVLGASARRDASGNQALGNLAAAGFAGEVHVVHPDGGTIDGYRAVASLSDTPRDLDAALVSLPAHAVASALLELEERGCSAALVPTVGMTQADRDVIDGIAHRGRMVVAGPNTLGIMNVSDAVPLVFWRGWLTTESRGRVALVAQSGGAAVGVVKSTVDRAFSLIVASGSEWDLTTADYLTWLAGDARTRGVGVVVESIADAAEFREAVERLRGSGTAVVALNVGRTGRGADIAVAHTAGLIGSAQAYRAFFRELAVPVVDDYDEMAAALDCLSRYGAAPRRRGRVAVVTESGGIAALAADLAEATGCPLAPLASETEAELSRLLPGSHASNPYDSGGSLEWSAERFAGAIRAVASDSGTSAVVIVVDGQRGLTEAEMGHEADNAAAVAAASVEPGAPLIVASSTSTDIHPAWRDAIGPGTPIVRGLRNGLVAARAVVQSGHSIRPAPGRSATAAQTEVLDLARAHVAAHRSDDVLPSVLGRRLLEAYDVPIVRSMLAESVDGVAVCAEQIGSPVVVKLASRDVPHRTEVGAVVAGLATPQEARAAAGEIARRVQRLLPQARIDGFEVQEHVASPFEVILGSVVDPVVGPVVTVGLGGVLVDVLGPAGCGLAPLDPQEAMEVFADTGVGRLLAGHRGLVPPQTAGAMAACMSSLSALAYDAKAIIGQIDLNPALVDADTGRITVVDWLFVPRGQPDPTSHVQLDR